MLPHGARWSHTNAVKLARRTEPGQLVTDTDSTTSVNSDACRGVEPPGEPAPTGILAVWNDRDDAVAELYEPWYVGQHLPERVNLPGWRFGRRYERLDAEGPRYFTWYELDSSDACESPEYRSRLENPTSETQMVMRNWRNMSRTVCTRAFHNDARLFGGFVVVARFDETVCSATLGELAALGSPLASQGWLRADGETRGSGATGQTAEQSLRGVADERIEGALLLEFLREGDATAALCALREGLGARGLHPSDVAAYAFLCEYR
jgi:hypothetical protein